MPSIKPIIITSGEPAGIGPDLVVMLAQQAWDLDFVVLADPDLLQERAQMLGLPLKIELYSTDQTPTTRSGCGHLQVLPLKLGAKAKAGKLNVANADFVIQMLTRAVSGCMSGEFSAMVTGPVHKGIINEAGLKFSGHTELLAEQSNTNRVVMMLATPGLRVALATTHLPLRDVADAITKPLVREILTITHQALQTQFAIPAPKIFVAGLNPHAGEDGHMGMEEIETINPVISELQNLGMDITGSYPADTMFTPDKLAIADAFVAMYHDQGLPVLKHKGFGNGVNITLGLPFIRTSVDHGTALDLAGTGKANAGSFNYAIRVAIEMLQAQASANNLVKN